MGHYSTPPNVRKEDSHRDSPGADSQSSGYPDCDWSLEEMHGPAGSTDGQADHSREKKGKRMCAIFIHAGAGFHSLQNEKIHLEACSDSAAIGMKFLKAGATATEAVEAALRILEDKEITNAGYGSNLSMDGVVECDATIVDHHGRSGACGAVPNIRNPVCLAKLILDRSNTPLTLRRVPPNILVGDGARAFAAANGMVVTPNNAMVSRNARDRFLRWQEDLKRAEQRLQHQQSGRPVAAAAPVSTTWSLEPWQFKTTRPAEAATDAAAAADQTRKGDARQPDHTNALLTGTWNEGQTDSPLRGSPASQDPPSPSPNVLKKAQNPLPSTQQQQGPGAVRFTAERSPLSFLGSMRQSDRSPSPKRSKFTNRHGAEPMTQATSVAQQGERNGDAHGSRDGSVSPYTATIQAHGSSGAASGPAVPTVVAANGGGDKESLFPGWDRGVKRPFAETGLTSCSSPASDHEEEDSINDTVGAIAIDENGCIAAASSSGGIGMKHHGRIGPAALVGVGTAVVPARDSGILLSGLGSSGDNPPWHGTGVSVAAVTSGTGEHMATTMASQRCAERILHGTRAGPGGEDIPEPDDDAVLESFVVEDFMNHPGVRGCTSVGAIGVMAVKRTPGDGAYFYFAHNTDSFALASMGPEDTEPLCVMSRLGERKKVARGARKIR